MINLQGDERRGGLRNGAQSQCLGWRRFATQKVAAAGNMRAVLSVGTHRYRCSLLSAGRVKLGGVDYSQRKSSAPCHATPGSKNVLTDLLFLRRTSRFSASFLTASAASSSSCFVCERTLRAVDFGIVCFIAPSYGIINVCLPGRLMRGEREL